MSQFSHEQIINRIKKIIVEISGYDEDVLTLETLLRPNGGMDEENTDEIFNTSSPFIADKKAQNESRIALEEFLDEKYESQTDAALPQEDTLSGETTDQSHNKQALNISSLELAELLITIDEEFGVNIPDAEAIQLNTLKSLVDYIIANS